MFGTTVGLADGSLDSVTVFFGLSLFDEAYLIYGFTSFSNKIHDALEEAIHGLLKARRVSISGGGLCIIK